MRSEGLSGGGCGEADIILRREAERAEGEMDLMFRKVMLRLALGMGMGRSMCMEIARWSEIWRLRLES